MMVFTTVDRLFIATCQSLVTFSIFSDVWFHCLVDLYIDCFHSNCLICYIYYDLISHP